MNVFMQIVGFDLLSCRPDVFLLVCQEGNVCIHGHSLSDAKFRYIVAF